MFTSAKKVVWPLLALHYSDAYWLPILFDHPTDVNNMNAIVPRKYLDSPMSANKAKDIITWISDKKIYDLQYQPFSFELIKFFLQAKRVTEITIAWNDAFGEPITMVLRQKSSIEGSRVPLTTSHILNEDRAFPYNVKHGDPLAVVKNVKVRFDFRKVLSTLPVWAYNKLIQEIDPKLDLTASISCEEINNLKLPTFTFSPEADMDKETFTLSAPNYFVQLPNQNCVFGVKVIPIGSDDTWVIGAALLKTYRIVFEEKGTYSLPFTEEQLLDLKK